MSEEALPLESFPPVEARPNITLVTEETSPLGAARYGPGGRVAKRLIDIVFSAALLIILSPVLAIIAVAVRRTSPGPALFRQTRVGYREEPFTILKFRTMAVDNDAAAHREYVQAMLRGDIPADAPSLAEADSSPQTVFKLIDDPRVTPLGEWLRAKSLDELPQLINVLKGEMSLVGPRPTLDYEVSEYQPHHRCRALSMPGMTGLWQVGGRSDLHMTKALDLDVVYVQTCSFWGDLVILARTVRVVSRGTGV